MTPASSLCAWDNIIIIIITCFTISSSTYLPCPGLLTLNVRRREEEKDVLSSTTSTTSATSGNFNLEPLLRLLVLPAVLVAAEVGHKKKDSYQRSFMEKTVLYY